MTLDQWRQVIDRIQELQLALSGLATRVARLHPDLFEKCEPHFNAIAQRLQLMTDEAIILLRQAP